MRRERLAAPGRVAALPRILSVALLRVLSVALLRVVSVALLRVVAIPRFTAPVRLVSAALPRIVPVAFVRVAVLGVLVHVRAPMAIRSAAMPREPYALTEPSDMPRVSATWASVMSAK